MSTSVSASNGFFSTESSPSNKFLNKAVEEKSHSSAICMVEVAAILSAPLH